MSDFLDRFFGHGDPGAGDGPVANPAVEAPLSLQLLFDAPLDLDPDALTLALRAFHPDLAAATAELQVAPRQGPPAGHPENDAAAGLFGLVGWGRHAVKLIGVNAPMPREAVESCVRPAHFGEELKRVAYENAAHVLLYYAGYDPDPLEQYVALGAVSAALTRLGAAVALNESARAAVPAAVFLPDESGEDVLEILRHLPVPFLYGGFIKLEVEGHPGVWMRTFGNHLLGLPNLALRAAGHHEGQRVFDLFANVLAYLRETGKAFAPGHTMQVGDDEYLRLREPADGEWFLDAEGEMLVAERITADEVNR